MPHFIVEYSANLEQRLDMAALCHTIRVAALADGLFEAGGIRVRAYPARHYAIADADPQNAFLHLQLRVGAGRPVERLHVAGVSIFAALRDALADELSAPHFGLSFEIQEIHPRLSWKANTMHARLAGRITEGRSS